METAAALRGRNHGEKRKRKEGMDFLGRPGVSARTARRAQQLSPGGGEKGCEKRADVRLQKVFDERPVSKTLEQREADADA